MKPQPGEKKVEGWLMPLTRGDVVIICDEDGNYYDLYISDGKLVLRNKRR